MMKRALCLLAWLLLWPGCVGQAMAGAPTFLWELRDTQGSVKAWLFGTIHVCNEQCYPLPAEVREALAAADLLALELDPADPKLGPRLRDAALLPPGKTLDRRLPAALRPRLARVAGSLGLPAEALQRMRPWMAATLLSLQSAEAAGYAARHGVDLWLAGDARSRGQPLVALETAERQVRALSGGGERAQLAYLAEVVDMIERDEAAAYYDSVLRAWRGGDAAALDQLMREEMAGEAMAPLLDELLDRRNREMALRIERQLRDGRKPFVAVGAGHLGGNNGLLAEMERRGYQLRRVEAGGE